MAYSAKAREQRRCRQTTKTGAPCQQYALWGRNVCVSHSERQHKGPMSTWVDRLAAPEWNTHARYTPCKCVAYAWPHRPAGGLCRWPDPPLFRSLIESGRRSFNMRVRPRWARKLPRRL